MQGVAGKMRNRRLWALAPSTGIFLFLFAAPLAMLFVVSFWSKKLLRVVPDFTVENYISAVERYGEVALNTLGIAAGTAIATTVLAFLFAYVIPLQGGPLRRRAALRESDHPVRRLPRQGLRVEDDSRTGGDSELGLARESGSSTSRSAPSSTTPERWWSRWCTSCCRWLCCRSTPRCATCADITLEAARDLGARPWQVVFGVVLPQCRAGLLAALIFTFLIAVGDYVTPQFLGGTTGSMIGVFIGNQFSIRFDWPPRLRNVLHSARGVPDPRRRGALRAVEVTAMSALATSHGADSGPSSSSSW